MKLVNIGNNKVVVENAQATVLFSYSAPVGGFLADGRVVCTEKNWSRTTSRHIKEWLGERKVEVVPQSFINDLVTAN